MSLDTIFTVRNEHITRLNVDEAIRFFARLLHVEAMRIGLPVTALNISARTNVADGGVDAAVSQNPPVPTGLLPKGRTVFQVKTGGFKPWQQSEIHNELFGSGRPAAKDQLGDHLRNCLDEGYRYVLVCTGVDLTDEERQQAQANIAQAFRDCGYLDPQVDVFSLNQLIGLLIPFPSLSLALNGGGVVRFQTVKSWSRDDQMMTDFKEGPEQTALIEGIRESLRSNNEAVHTRVLGEAGVGKTRLVLRALQAPDLQELVIYCDNPSIALEDGLVNLLVRDDNSFVVILVVDECDAETRGVLWNKLKHRGSRIKLVTLYNDFEAKAGNILIYELPPLDDKQIAQILQDYLPPSESTDRWVGFCGGSPRMAHLLGSNLKNNPEDPLRPGDTVNAWNRIVAGGDKLDSPEVQQRRLLLQHIALFKRLGYEGDLASEANTVAELVQSADPAITLQRFHALIQTLRHRRILQGDATLYISPELLHIQMWKEWWENYRPGFKYEDFQARLSPKLTEWFHEMFKYAAESNAARAVVEELLGPNGHFRDGQLLKDPRGARFFHALTEAAPAAALRRLQETLGRWNRDELLAFGEGRRQIVWALEKIAVWRENFQDAARLLLALAEAENETWSNNATGVFQGLFTPAHAPISPTEAPPEERLPVLVEALDSPSADRRKVALGAFEDALQTGNFSRTVGPEHQGLRRQPQLWMPKTWGEVFDGYRRPWHLLEERLDTFSAEERRLGTKTLLQAARGLAHHGNLIQMVVDTLSGLLDKPYVDKRDVIKVVENIYHYDAKGFTPDIHAIWQPLRNRLEPTDFATRMERYVAMELLVDSFDDDGNRVDKVGPQIEALADEALKDSALLEKELTWLVTDKAKNGFRFGYALGCRDSNANLLERLLDAQRTDSPQRSAFFLGGYLRALRARDPEMHESLLDRLSFDAALRHYVPELTWRTDLNDSSARRVLRLAKDGVVDADAFRMFAFGGVVRNLSEGAFHEWVEHLLALNTRSSVSIALDLFHFYYIFDQPRAFPEDLTFRLLIAEPFVGESTESGRQQEAPEHEWNEVAKAFVDTYPHRAVELADHMFRGFSADGSVLDGYHSQAQETLGQILRKEPERVWQLMTGYLGPPIDSRAFKIQHWLREGSLTLVPADAVFKWVEEDVEQRAWYAASFVPPSFPGVAGACTARELLVRYGDRDDVRRNLMANFGTEMWSGPASAHYRAKKEWLLTLRVSETHPNVLRWLDEYSAGVERNLKQARIEEERDGF